MKKQRILITGASGFIGHSLVQKLFNKKSYELLVAIRNNTDFDFAVEKYYYDGFPLHDKTCDIVNEIDFIVHSAARAHIINENLSDSLTEYRSVNTKGTLQLAELAARSGVKRFIYLSSIKVNGEFSEPGNPFTENDICMPTDPYAVSKHEAEIGLIEISNKTGMEVVIIRPPLVYGPGVKANFLNMMKWLYRRIPLPFGAIHNKRSLVAIDNLIDLIITCIKHPSAANQVFLVSDGKDLSTTELLSKVATALGKKSGLIPINQQLLEIALKLIGKKDLGQRLCGSLQVDISKAKKILNWTPLISVDEGLDKTAKYYLESKSA